MIQHVAIIMDGNGRWAKAKGVPRLEGHRKGAEAARRAMEAAITNKIPYLTIYAFSSENWNRPADEVKDLMSLLKNYLKQEVPQLNKNNIRLRVIGDRERLDNDIQKYIVEAEASTAGNTALNLNIALSYGGRQEIAAAARKLAESAIAGRVQPDEIDDKVLGEALYTAGQPEPDLLIRTGGEHRISNFLLWQMAYTELYFSPVLWPDFGQDEFNAALEEFNRRERRFGSR